LSNNPDLKAFVKKYPMTAAAKSVSLGRSNWGTTGQEVDYSSKTLEANKSDDRHRSVPANVQTSNSTRSIRRGKVIGKMGQCSRVPAGTRVNERLSRELDTLKFFHVNY
jgi:hypothetical protein